MGLLPTLFRCSQRMIKNFRKKVLQGYVIGLVFGAVTFYLTNIDHPHHEMNEFEYFKFFKSDVEQKRIGELFPFFCLVSTSSKGLHWAVPALQFTWTQRCSHAHFLVTSEDQPERYDMFSLSDLVFFKYSYKYGMNSTAKWFLRTTDDVFLIVQKLDEYLLKFDSDKPYGFFLVQQDENAGEKSRTLIVSKGALLKVLHSNSDVALSDSSQFSCVRGQRTIAECFKKLGIYTSQVMISRKPDENKQECQDLNIQHIYQQKDAKDSSATALDHIFLHPVLPGGMYMMDYLLNDNAVCRSCSTIDKH